MKSPLAGVGFLSLAWLAFSLGCGGSAPPPAETSSVGGTVTGLSGPGFELLLEHAGGSEILPVGVDGAFAFRTRLAGGEAYEVTVWAQPYGQRCEVSGGAGTVGSGAVSSIAVACAMLPTFTVGGAVTGLTGAGLVLANVNPGSTDLVAITSDGAFVFPAQPDGTPYRVGVRDQPAGQSCTVSAGEGTLQGASVTAVEISCSSLPTVFAVRGVVSGLAPGASVALALDRGGAREVLVASANGAFAFAAALGDGEPWAVSVETQPAGQSCTVAQGSGTISGADVDDVAVGCASPGATYTVGGLAFGLSGAGLVLGNDAGGLVDEVEVDADGAFTFPGRVADGASYAVVVLAAPAGQDCTVVNASGVVSGANVTSLGVTCRTLRRVGGTVVGLAGGTVTLRNTPTADSVTVTVDGPFAFTLPVPDGGGYAVTVTAQPGGRSCTVAGGSGTVSGADVTSVAVTCTEATPLEYSTYAGDMGGSGNADGRGAFARFNLPMGLGGGFVADRGNGLLRRVTEDGTVVTASARGANFSDGPLAEATFLAAQAIAEDTSGAVYVAETGRHRIRRIEGEAVTTVAGAGAPGSQDGTGAAARFFSPGGVAVAPDGVVYVADTGNHTVRRVTPAGEVSTLAGAAGQFGYLDATGPDARFFSPTAIAVDPVTGTIYVGDLGNRRIRAVTPGGVVTTVAGGVAGFRDSPDPLQARFQSLDGMAIDPSGALYVADAMNGVIRRVDAAGVSTFAGVPRTVGSEDGPRLSARFRAPAALAFRGADLWVADTGNHTIRRIDPSGEVTTVAGAAARSGRTDGSAEVALFLAPMGVAPGADPGVLFVVDRAGQNVRRIDPDPVTGGASTVITVAGSGLTGSTDGVGSAARFDNPWAITAGGRWVADSANRILRHVDEAGNVTTVAGGPGVSGLVDGVGAAARFISPVGVWAAPTGEVYVADVYAIRRFDPATAEVLTVAGAASAGFADGTGDAARFRGVEGITGDAAGNLYVADKGNHSLRKILPGGTVVTLAGGPAAGYLDGPLASASFREPTDLALAGDGTIYVADGGNGCIRRISPAGEVSTFLGTPGVVGFAPAATPSALGTPRKLALVGDLLYVTMYQGVARFRLAPPP